MLTSGIRRMGCAGFSSRAGDDEVVEPGGAPRADGAALDRPGPAPPLRVGRAGHWRQSVEPFPRDGGDGSSEGMLARVLQGAGEPQGFVLLGYRLPRR